MTKRVRHRAGTRRTRSGSGYYTRRILLLALSTLLLAFDTNTCAQSLRGNEDEIKAAFLANFAKLVEWPPTAFAEKTDPLTVCVFGSNPITLGLEQLLQGKSVSGRIVSVSRIARAENATHCQMLFVSYTENRYFRDVFKTVGNSPVLTVGDSSGFAHAGGIINFFQQSDGLRFEINLAAADRAGLKIDSRVLGLARIVREVGKSKK